MREYFFRVQDVILVGVPGSNSGARPQTPEIGIYPVLMIYEGVKIVPKDVFELWERFLSQNLPKSLW